MKLNDIRELRNRNHRTIDFKNTPITLRRLEANTAELYNGSLVNGSGIYQDTCQKILYNPQNMTFAQTIKESQNTYQSNYQTEIGYQQKKKVPKIKITHSYKTIDYKNRPLRKAEPSSGELNRACGLGITQGISQISQKEPYNPQNMMFTQPIKQSKNHNYQTDIDYQQNMNYTNEVFKNSNHNYNYDYDGIFNFN